MPNPLFATKKTDLRIIQDNKQKKKGNQDISFTRTTTRKQDTTKRLFANKERKSSSQKSTLKPLNWVQLNNVNFV
jgi:hypothetical protein